MCSSVFFGLFWTKYQVFFQKQEIMARSKFGMNKPSKRAPSKLSRNHKLLNLDHQNSSDRADCQNAGDPLLTYLLPTLCILCDGFLLCLRPLTPANTSVSSCLCSIGRKRQPSGKCFCIGKPGHTMQGDDYSTLTMTKSELSIE